MFQMRFKVFRLMAAARLGLMQVIERLIALFYMKTLCRAGIAGWRACGPAACQSM